MTTLNLPAVTSPKFSVEASQQGADIVVALRGTADIPAREQFDRFIESLHVETRRIGGKQIIVDFMKLDFMNSSCMKTLVSWITGVQELPPPEQYQICFRSNREILWQRRSLQALKCFADNLVRIEA